MRKIFNNKMWFMALLLVVAVAGCGGDDDGGGSSGPGPAGAAPVLGAASTYGIFASSNAAITLADNSTGAGSLVNGDVGLMDGLGVCTGCDSNSVTGAVHNGDTAAQQAQIDFSAAYDEASLRATNLCTLVSGDLADPQAVCPNGVTPGPIYGPGLYKFAATGFGIGVGRTITLDAKGNPNAVFIFQTDNEFTTGTGSIVVLAGKAKAKNVFWVVGSAATLGVSSQFKGTVIANSAAVTINGGTSLLPTLVEGRLFSRGAAATVGAYATITVPAP